MPFASKHMASSPVFALQRLQELAGGSPGEAMVLRLTVEGGGCSGYTYNFTLEDGTRPDDKCAAETPFSTQSACVDGVSKGALGCADA